MHLIVKKFLDYFNSLGYQTLEPSNIVGKDDILFINSGMAPMKKYFYGTLKHKFNKIITIQPCVRISGKHNDILEVGDSPIHHTYFNMMGHFCLHEINTNVLLESINFLIKILEISSNRIKIMYAPNVNIIQNMLNEMHAEYNNILTLSDNLLEWSVGEYGPKGNCIEIYIDNEEIWNLVFVDKVVTLDKTNYLENIILDSGMGLERIIQIVENKDNTYDISTLSKYIDIINKAINIENTNLYSSEINNKKKFYRIISDHIRCIYAMIKDGVVPSNKKTGHILKRIIRRMLFSFIIINGNKNNLQILLQNIKNLITNDIGTMNFELANNIINKEFNIVAKLIIQVNNIIDKSNKYINAQDLFFLHTSKGITIDMLQYFSKQKNCIIDIKGFNEILYKSI